MIKIILIISGTVFAGIGILGIIIPGLPATTFFLLAAACYARSSEKLYNKLINHKIAGKFIRDYQTERAISLKHKIISLSMMWISILTSAIFFINNHYTDLAILLCGVTGTYFILRIKTKKSKPAEILNIPETE